MEESLRSILEMFKDDIITIDETLDLIKAMDNGPRNVKVSAPADASPGLPWDDDRKMRIVAYIGRKLIKKGGTNPDFNVEIEGSPLNVECWGSLTCEDIGGNAAAGTYIECGDIGNNAAAGGNVECGDIGGDVSCNTLNCGDIGGSRIE